MLGRRERERKAKKISGIIGVDGIHGADRLWDERLEVRAVL